MPFLAQRGDCEDECQFGIVGNSHRIGMVKKHCWLLVGVKPCCLPVFWEKRPAHLNKDWTFSLPIQTKGEEERSTAERTESSIRAPWRRTGTPTHTPSYSHLKTAELVNCLVWRPSLSPGSIAARTPCSHDVIPVDSAIRKPADCKRQGTG